MQFFFITLMLRITKWSLGSLLGTVSGIVGLDSHGYVDLTNFSSVRAIRTGMTTFKTIVDYKWTLHNIEPHSSTYLQAKSQVHKRAAHRLLKLCWRNRGTFIKVGQHLGGMDYLLPEEYTRVLKILHSNAPQSTVQELEQVAIEELSITNFNELFDEFNEKPLGTASLAQVHKAKLKEDGSVVAVKIQHPNVRNLATKDMKMMDIAVNLVNWFFLDFDLLWLSEETKANLPIELDFSYEAQNCHEAAENLKNFPWVKLPKIYWKYSTQRILVMEYLEGGHVNDCVYLKKHSIKFEDVARLLGKLFSEMIFVHGFVHCDPHPGNILVRSISKNKTFWQKVVDCKQNTDLEILMLDHGLYRRLSKKFRYDYASLWQAIINQDLVNIEKYSRAIGAGDLYPILVTIVTGRAWKVVSEDGIQNVDFTTNEDNAIRDGASSFLPHISQVLSKVPREMLLVLKTNDHIRGLEHAFGVRGHQSGFLDMSRCCLKALFELQLENPKRKFFCHYIVCFSHLLFGLVTISAVEWYLWILDLFGVPPARSQMPFAPEDITGKKIHSIVC